MLKNSENNGTEEIGLVTPTPGIKRPDILHELVSKPLSRLIAIRVYTSKAGKLIVWSLVCISIVVVGFLGVFFSKEVSIHN